jgi:endo-1,4-beta-xylanase
MKQFLSLSGRGLIVLATALLAGSAIGNAAVPQASTLKEAYKPDFLIGVAVNTNQIFEHDTRGVPIIKSQFDSISPENALKWGPIHPEPDQYNFGPADRYVEFGETNHMAIIGHTLVWHSQTPRWVFRDANGNPVDRETLLNRMSNHIHTVVGRYKGRIQGWDVVNEALNESGKLRSSQWMQIIGEDYITKAFQFAHEADPDAQLQYNDYGLESEPKRGAAVALIKKLQADGVQVAAIGIQGHYKLKWPTAKEVDATISAFAKLGVKVTITELDVDVVPASQRNRSADVAQNAQTSGGSNPYANGLPDEVQQELAKRYADLFEVFRKHKEVVSRVTFWGVTDADSWLNSFRRTNYPLLFDREGKPKPAFNAVLAVARTSQP